ncbi:mucin-like protein [Physella acuta]|uniref:mucin-like protein n=1 Tax=Physella acuta TaxID=109671 RepID=UPI0027DCE748|nr:mucin-like protein [Physella acuta]
MATIAASSALTTEVVTTTDVSISGSTFAIATTAKYQTSTNSESSATFLTMQSTLKTSTFRTLDSSVLTSDVYMSSTPESSVQTTGVYTSITTESPVLTADLYTSSTTILPVSTLEVYTSSTLESTVETTEVYTNAPPESTVPTTELFTFTTSESTVPTTEVYISRTPESTVPTTELFTFTTSESTVPTTEVHTSSTPELPFQSKEVLTSTTPESTMPTTEVPTSTTPESTMPTTEVPTSTTPESSAQKTYVPTFSTTVSITPTTEVPTSTSPEACNATHYGLNCANTCICHLNNTVDCNDTTGECLCAAGWNGTTCDEDVDECLNINYCLEANEICFNLNGSAECLCDFGFQRSLFNYSCEACSASSYGPNCKSKCTCVFNNTADCNDTSGACLCKSGWNGTNCELDINECLNKSYCLGVHEECNNLQGSAECRCELGFDNRTGVCQACNTTSYGFYCGNKCSCVMNNTIDCNDTTGSCLCASGWTGTKCDTDINECLSTSYCVGFHEKCYNLNGSAECKCLPGYEKNNGTCQVCNKTHYGLDCSLKCVCVMENTIYCNGRSGACLCSPGWNGTNCEKDINECDNINYCTEVHASCFNLNGSAECRCDNGYRKLSSGKCQALCPNCTEAEVCFDETADKWICRFNDSCIYPYGRVQKDQSLPKNKELASANLYIEDFIPYQLKLISSVWITVNGLISFDEEYSSFNPQKLPVLDTNLNQHNVLAAYWTDLDVNEDDNCEVYYQMYDLYSNNTLGTAVFTKANADVMALTENKSYNATTVIVVTWVNVPAHGSVDERVSFQCVIISDGHTTYAIYIYIQGAMKFKPLSARNVEVGWANFSFDTSLTSYYRFDTVLGNTGKPGLWIFKVGENKNFKMMCRTWFISNQGELPTIDLWNKNLLPACPCNEVAAKSSPIWVPSSLAYSDRNCFDLLPFYGEYGRRCCYKADESSSFFNTIPQAGSLLRYNSFIYKEHDQLDEDPKDWCCTKSNLCDLYYTLRPIFSCNGSNWASSFLFGDPHIITLDQRSFIFNGLGEYHLVQIIGATNQHFKLQGRTCRALNSNGNETLATVWCALSMTSGDENSLRVEISPSRKIMIIYANKRDYTTEYLSNPNFFTFDNKMILRKQNGALEVSLPESIGMTVTLVNELLEFSLTLDKKYQKMTTGLLGNFNGDKTDDFICPNGTQLSDDSSEKQLYEYGKLWAITQNESLFQYSYGQSTSTFSNPNFTPLFYDEQNPTTIAEAEKICNGSGNLPCIFNFIATQNEKIAEISLKSSVQFEKVSVSTGKCKNHNTRL